MISENPNGGSILTTDISIPSAVYNLDTVKKTAYRFTAEAAFSFDMSGEAILCSVSFATPRTEAQIKVFKDAFQIELLDQDLRRVVATETASIRNAVLAYAFSRTGLQDE